MGMIVGKNVCIWVSRDMASSRYTSNSASHLASTKCIYMYRNLATEYYTAFAMNITEAIYFVNNGKRINSYIPIIDKNFKRKPNKFNPQEYYLL